MLRDKDSFDPSQPALLVTYGNTTKKHRPLDGDVIVLGRGSVCDFNLVSPEVAPVHCLIVHVGEGWKLRDCSGRPGTRVNGKTVQEVLLDDGDVIQVGAFSFQVHLPAGHTPHEPPIARERVDRLQRSRRRLIDWVQRLRKQLGERFLAVERADSRLASERADLIVRWEAVQSRERDYQLRMMRLELSERDVTTDRATLEKEYRTLQEDAERHATNVRLFKEEAERSKTELEEQRANIQAELQALSHDWHRGGERMEARQTASEDQTRQLDLRARELNHYARHLKRPRRDAAAMVPVAVAAPEPVAEPLDEMTRLMAELREAIADIRSVERRPSETPSRQVERVTVAGR